MRLASYKMRGRPSFGAVVGDGVVDLRSRLSRFTSLLDVLRAGALDEAKAVIGGVRPDLPLSEVELLPPLAAPEKILCVGINYANRGKDYDLAENPNIRTCFTALPIRFSGTVKPSSGLRFPSSSTTRARLPWSSAANAKTSSRKRHWK